MSDVLLIGYKRNCILNLNSIPTLDTDKKNYYVNLCLCNYVMFNMIGIFELNFLGSYVIQFSTLLSMLYETKGTKLYICCKL